MAVNDLYQKIIKQVFKGNVGKQLALLRSKIEVIEFERYCKDNNITPNTKQQEYINKINKEYGEYNKKVLMMIGKQSIYDLQDEQETSD